jgi:hypothetical protein
VIVTDGIEGLRDVNRVTVKFFTRRSASDAPLRALVSSAQQVEGSVGQR